ncbi:MAG TPA: flavoprotein [Streptosporangiaceae bacterium]|nr:flavoprotein [Streptosporangiaceae bacterium]
MLFSTPTGIGFIDPAELERLTGEPVRSEYRMPGTGSPVPAADAVLACPLTFNSVNKFAHGHADNFAVGLLCEIAGYGVPVVVVPHCKAQLASHPAFAASLQTPPSDRETAGQRIARARRRRGLPSAGQQGPRGDGRAGEWSVLERVLAGCRYRSADGAAGPDGGCSKGCSRPHCDAAGHAGFRSRIRACEEGVQR